MRRTLEAIRTKDLPALFSFFGIAAEKELILGLRDEITARFLLEVREIERLCKRLRERERFQLFREALRLAYEGARLRHAAA